MSRARKYSFWLLSLAVGCTAASPPKQASPTRPDAPPSGAREAAKPEPIVAATANLPRRAFELSNHGQALAALHLLLGETHQRLRANDWRDEMLVAESVIAALEIERLTASLNAWEPCVASLESNKPFAPGTPPELAALLDQTLAQGLRRLDRVGDARALTLANGALIDWLIIGPFANERGTGFDAKYPPEDAIDLEHPVLGKEKRDVAWRPNPVPEHALGALRLDKMLRPNEQAIAYAATSLYADKAREVVLDVGSSGAIKIFANGSQVLARKVQRPFHQDQDRVVIPLHAGWNRIVVKLGVDEAQPWIFVARACELDGRPCVDLKSDSKHLVDPVTAVEPSTSKPSPSARQILETHKDNAEAVRMLVMFHLALHPDDVADHTAKAWAERSIALEPTDTQGLFLLARANAPEAGADESEVQVNARLLPLKDVLARDPQHVAALLELARFAMFENPTPERADQWTRRAVELAPDSWQALTLRAQFLAGRQRSAESELLDERARQCDEGKLRTDSLLARAHRLRQRGDVEGGLTLLRQGFDHGQGDDEVVDALVHAYLDRGELDAALALTNEQLERAPFDVERMLSSARLLEFAGRLPDARALVARALRVCPENTQAHFALARMAQREDDLATADKELAEVVRLDPGYSKAQRQRQVLAATAQEHFEEPYRWDALERVGAAQAKANDNEPVCLLDRTTVWRVNPDGSEHRYEHLLFRAQNLGGVKSLDRYGISYPDDGTLQVFNVRVIHADQRYERAPAPRGSGRGWRGFDLPPLEVGDCVEVEYRVDESRADVFGQYFGTRHEFYADFPDAFTPTLRSELVVISPKDVPLYTSERNASALEKSTTDDEHGNVVHRWIARDLKRPAMESAMPERSEIAPVVDITTFASWQAFATWWWSFIEKDFVTSPAMKDKVRELTTGVTAERDKVRAIARFVGQEIRYNAWPFGTHGYEPYSAATIFERRFGDCKDKSILLRQMLAEIGVEAHPVLIKAEYRRPIEPLDSAMLEHFNHCIAYLPATKEREGYYLDATADRDPIEYLRADDQGASVLHVRDGKGEIHVIPYAPPDENSLVRDYEVALDESGGGEVHLVDTSNGQFGVALRYELGGETGDLNKRLSEVLAAEFGKVDILAATTSKLEDIAEPAKLDTQLRASGLWSRDASGANLRLSFDPIEILDVAGESPQERVSDLVLDRPFAMRTRVLYRLPAGAKVAKLPTDASVVAPGVLEYHMTARATPEGVEVKRDFKLLERRIDRAHYADFRGALRDVQLAEERTIVLETPASTDAKRSEASIKKEHE